jgi:hypothetical protein
LNRTTTITIALYRTKLQRDLPDRGLVTNMEAAKNPPLDEVQFSEPAAVAFYGGINAHNSE